MTGFTPDAPVLHEIKNHSEELTKAEAGVAAFAAKRNNRWYPKFHIASNGGWINDPNGLCFYKGRWHVFYQLHPYGTQWGPMHWGHVSSTDMVNWKREPIMFAPSLEEEKDGVFSGSAVIGDDGKPEEVKGRARFKRLKKSERQALDRRIHANSLTPEIRKTLREQLAAQDCPFNKRERAEVEAGLAAETLTDAELLTEHTRIAEEWE